MYIEVTYLQLLSYNCKLCGYRTTLQDYLQGKHAGDLIDMTKKFTAESDEKL